MTQITSNLYSQGFGATPSASLTNAVIFQRPPSPSDIQGPNGKYPVGQLWIDQNTESAYQLIKYESTAGLITASWISIGGGTSQLSQLSGDTGVALPIGGNINIIGGAGVVTSASSDNVTISLVGGTQAVESFIPDSGTSPVFPNASGIVSMRGQSVSGSGISSIGGTNVINFQMDSPFTGGSLSAGVGQFTFQSTVAATNQQIYSINTDNTNATSHAGFTSKSGGTSGGDSYFSCGVGATRAYGFGIATPTSGQPLQISTSAASEISPSNGTALWKMTSGGARTMPLQPSIVAYLPSTTAAVSGTDVLYILGTAPNPLTIVSQQGGMAFDGSTITVPVTGTYQFSFFISLGSLDSSANGLGIVWKVNGAGTYYGSICNPASIMKPDLFNAGFAATVTIPLVATNTVNLQIEVSGQTSAPPGTVTVIGSAAPYQTWISGYLLF